MAREQRAPARKGGGGGGARSMIVGIVIGLVLGLGAALGVVLYVNKHDSPFVTASKGENGATQGTAAPAPTKAAKTPAKPDANAKVENGAKPAAGGDAAAKGKPRFDFYTILPGSEEPVTEQELKQPAPSTGKEVYYLQAGSFQSPDDAENLKARIALMGQEAEVTTATIPDKGTWHRVRLGPFKSLEELIPLRDLLKKNSVDASTVRVREGAGA